MGNKKPSEKDRFKSEGKGATNEAFRLTVRFPPEIGRKLQDIKDRNDFVRDAVAEKLNTDKNKVREKRIIEILEPIAEIPELRISIQEAIRLLRE